MLPLFDDKQRRSDDKVVFESLRGQVKTLSPFFRHNLAADCAQ